MKILIISSAALPSPVMDGYGGLELVTGLLTMEFAKQGHDVTLVTSKGSVWEGEHPIVRDGQQISTMKVICTVDPIWTGDGEYNHYMAYKDILEKEFSNQPRNDSSDRYTKDLGDSIVLDHTWLAYSYLSKQKYPEMNLIHTHHGMLGFRSAPPVLYPRFLGLSSYHSQYISNVLNIPARHIHNGIPLVQFPPDYDPSLDKGDYLLSLNRITDEKGIHDAIDVAVSTNTPIKIVGDDTKVVSQQYVNNIIERCRNSGGLAQYLGLVDTNTKNNLLLKCKALIACPKQTWMEAFGLYAVEAMAYYKPVLALANGGLNDIILHGLNGFLAPNTEKLKGYVGQLETIDVNQCRQTVVTHFSKENMAYKYLDMFQKILDKDPTMNW